MSPITVIAILIAVVLTAVISVFATIAYRKSVSEAKVGSAEEKAREILECRSKEKRGIIRSERRSAQS